MNKLIENILNKLENNIAPNPRPFGYVMRRPKVGTGRCEQWDM